MKYANAVQYAQIYGRYKGFQSLLEKKVSRKTRSENIQIITEYDLVRRIQLVIDEISLMQPIFDDQYIMTRKLLKWVNIKTENSDKENIDSEDLRDWTNFQIADHTDVIKKRVQALEKEAQRVLKLVR
jgi:hypothetical protein